MSEEATNPVAEEELVSNPAEGVADEAPAQGDDQELDDEGNPIEGQAEDDDQEEVEHEGAKYKLPKVLAKEFREGLLRQADYTRKTQEVAETRKALDARQAEIAQQAEVQAQTLEERATLKALDAQLSQYQSVNWQQYVAEHGEAAAVAAMGHMRQLEQAKAQLNEHITSKEQEHRLKVERAAQTALQEADQLLAKEIPGYGADLVQTVAKTAQAVGFSAQEVRDSLIGPDGKADTRAFKVLARLAELETENATLKAKQTKAQTAEKQAAVTPAKTVKANGGQFKPGLDDSLPPDEWRRRFQAQLAKAR